MSRGDRVAVNGNLSTSMRQNYGEHGVAEYYKKVGSSYRNPHYPGIRLCLFSWFNRWWQKERENIISITSEQVMFFDMACGNGEATLAFVEWCSAGKRLYQESSLGTKSEHNQPSASGCPPTPHPRKGLIVPIALGPEFPKPQLAAADPFTAAAYKDRTSYPSSDLSFEAIAEGSLPSVSVNIADGSVRDITIADANEETEAQHLIEMIICSFALHLIENPSSLFALLWQLSLKARWLIILAPHKRPEIKDGWGWCKWDTDAWAECPIANASGEYLHDRVHCRVYRSVNT
ncbi:hypothetical protein BDZ97DRAFT_564572 [Flammula alnicola]|nr:hypothetical protein BDZ97DRAFT_564572 [Flammula alnicola]